MSHVKSSNCIKDFDQVLRELGDNVLNIIVDLEIEKTPLYWIELPGNDENYKTLTVEDIKDNALSYICRYFITKWLVQHSCSKCEAYIHKQVDLNFCCKLKTFCRTI